MDGYQYQEEKTKKDAIIKSMKSGSTSSSKRTSSSVERREKELIQRQAEKESEEIRRKDEKARDSSITKTHQDIDLKVKSQGSESSSRKGKDEKKEEKSLFSAVPAKIITTTSTSENSSIDENLNKKRSLFETSTTAIPLPYPTKTVSEEGEKGQSVSSPPLPSCRPPLERTISNVSSVHASVQASLSSSSSEDEGEEDERRERSPSRRVEIELRSDEQSKEPRSKENDAGKSRNQMSSFYFGTEDPVIEREEVFQVHQRSDPRKTRNERDREIEVATDRTRSQSPEARIHKTTYVEIHPDCRPVSVTKTEDSMSLTFSGHDTLSRRAAERRQRGIFLDGHEPCPPPPPPTLPKPTSWTITDHEPRLKSTSNSPIHSPKMRRKGWDKIEPDPDYEFDTKITSNAQGNYRLDITIEPEKVPEPPRVHRIFTTPSPTRIRKPWKPVSPTTKTMQMESVAKSRLFPNSTLTKSPSTSRSMVRSATITKSYSPTNTNQLSRLSRPITKTSIWPPPLPPMYRSSPTFVNRSKSSPVSSGSPSPTRSSPNRVSPARGSPTGTEANKQTGQRWPGVSASLTRPTISSRNKALSRS